MALSQTYCDFGAGNDYKGTTFTDGSFANATLTLTKAGAFAATKVNHWLYLADNGSGEVTAGYYRVTDITGAPNAVVLDADIRSGASDPTDVVCTQHDGTTTLPWRSVQGALDLITPDTTNGDQINIKAGTAQVNAAALDYTTHTNPSVTAPIVLRGYTIAANDGGVAEIDCGGATMFAAPYDSTYLIDLDIHTFGNNNGIALDDYNVIQGCRIHSGASTPSAKTFVVLDIGCSFMGNYLYDIGENNALNLGASGIIWGNYFDMDAEGNYYAVGSGVLNITNNIFRLNGVGCHAIYSMATAGVVYGNIIYNLAAGTSYAMQPNRIGNMPVCFNNIIVGQSGVGGVGILGGPTLDFAVLGHNAFYNNTANHSISGDIILDLTASDVALSADPFTDAANGDFSLTAAAKAALADKGFPTQYLGAHANTDPHLTIGPMQIEATTCDYPAEADVEAGVDYGSGTYTGTFVVPGVGDVEAGVEYGDSAEFTGTFAVPAVADVQSAVQYGASGTEFTGTFTAPDAADVRSGVSYGAAGTEFEGTYEASTTTNAITTGNVTTYQGDDYDTADGRQLDWTVASTATLTGGTVSVILPGVDTYTGSVTSETNVRLTLTAAQTAAIPVGKHKYQVLVTQTVALGSDVITVVEGTWHSKARVSE